MHSATLRVNSVAVAKQFEAHRYTGCDGYPTAAVFDALAVTTEDGREWYMPCGERVVDEDGFVGYRARYYVPALGMRVLERGYIDPQYWVELEEQPSLEEKFAQYAMEEQMERMGLGGWGV